MTTGKHGHFIKPLSIGSINWEEKQGQPGSSVVGPGNAKKEIWLNGRDHLEGMNFSLSWGVHTTIGEWHAGSKSHSHPYPECLFFVGLDTANVSYLGAEVEVCLGDEKEIHKFNDPTVIVIPAGFSHGPITTKRLFSPRGFGFFAAALNPEPGITWSGVNKPEAKPGLSAGNHAHLVKPLKSGLLIERRNLIPSRLTQEQLARREEIQKQKGFKQGPGNADHLAWMYGGDLEGLSVNIAWGFASQPGIWQRGVGAHSHPSDEILMFMGLDPDKGDDLGAEIEIDLGKEHERHFFSKSSAIVCPAGMAHGPIVTRWVDKPFAFLLINLAVDAAMSFE